MRWSPLLLAAATAWASEGNEQLRAAVARGLAAENAAFADAAKLSETTISPLPAVFERIKLWRFERFLDTRPLVFYVAVGDEVSLLTGHPERFSRLAQADPPRTAAAAVAMGRLFEETTRAADERLLLLESVDQVPFRPGITGADAGKRDRAKRELASRIKPPRAARETGGWRVTAYAIEGDALVEVTLDLDKSGVHRHTKTVRDDLPLAYAN